MSVSSAKTLPIYVGAYTFQGGKGIYLTHLDLSTGVLGPISLAAETVNPSFLALHPSGKFLYAANETMKFNGMQGGSVSAFSIDAQTGKLTFVNQQPTHGGAPCHVSVDHTGKCLMAANYMGGNVAAYTIGADGSLSEPTEVIQHSGSGPNPHRQDKPYAHSTNLTPDNRFVLAADLGIDRLMIYHLDPEKGKLTPNTVPFVQVQGGFGPRHLTFAPGGKFAYLITEMGCTVVVFAYDAEHGALSELQTLPTLPEGWKGENTCADIHFTPDGRFLYGSNRGHDSLVIYAVDQSSGLLTLVGHQSTLGKTPRNFAIDPTGQYLLVAHQDSNSIIPFRIDAETGHLHLTGQILESSMPVCLLFA